MQDPHTLIEVAKTRLGMDVRPRRNIFGQVVTRNPLIDNVTIPVSYSKWKEDIVVQRMMTSGALINMPAREIQNVGLNPDQYEKMMAYMEKLDIKGIIKEIVESPEYEAASDAKKAMDEEGLSADTKQGMIRLAYRRALQAAKEHVVSEDPELQKKILEFKLKSYNKPSITKGNERLLKNLGVDINK
jgi:hypothetical protein